MRDRDRAFFRSESVVPPPVDGDPAAVAVMALFLLLLGEEAIPDSPAVTLVLVPVVLPLLEDEPGGGLMVTDT